MVGGREPRAVIVPTPVATPLPVPGEAQSPIYPLIVGNNGGYLWVRASPAQGSCGVSGYPCKHPGVDVNGPPGTTVRSPTNGLIVQVANGQAAPFTGYGPWLVIIAGDDGRYHLIGHMAAGTSSMARAGQRVRAGDPIGTVSSAYHVHWEVRKKPVPAFSAGETNFTNNLDPIEWISSSRSVLGGKAAPMLLLGAAAVLLFLVARD